MKVEKRDMFIAEDGKAFLDKADCLKHEDTMRKVKYFRVGTNPELTDPGHYTIQSYIAVYADCFHKEIVFNYFLKTIGGYLGAGVMGYGYHPNFEIYPSTKAEYYEAVVTKRNETLTRIGQIILLSPIELEGFEERFDYCKEWGFK